MQICIKSEYYIVCVVVLKNAEFSFWSFAADVCSDCECCYTPVYIGVIISQPQIAALWARGLVGGCWWHHSDDSHHLHWTRHGNFFLHSIDVCGGRRERRKWIQTFGCLSPGKKKKNENKIYFNRKPHVLSSLFDQGFEKKCQKIHPPSPTSPITPTPRYPSMTWC